MTLFFHTEFALQNEMDLKIRKEDEGGQNRPLIDLVYSCIVNGPAPQVNLFSTYSDSLLSNQNNTSGADVQE